MCCILVSVLEMSTTLAAYCFDLDQRSMIFFGLLIFVQSFSNFVLYLQGIIAVLNLQRKNEQVNWGIDGEEIDNMAKQKGLIVVDVPIR